MRGDGVIDAGGHNVGRIVGVDLVPLGSVRRHHVIGFGDTLLELSSFVALGAKAAAPLARFGSDVQIHDEIGHRQAALRGLTPLWIEPIGKPS
jgi:hypothetical protein